jgi:hypothetical protein
MASQAPPERPDDRAAKTQDVWDVELLRVHVSRTGQRVDAEWAIHPQIKQDLAPEEWKEISQLMAKVTDIVGHRFSEILSTVEPDPPGHA